MKKIFCMILLCMMGILLIGCSSDDEGTKITLYYVNSDENSLVEEEYNLKTETKQEQIEELN